MRVREIFVGLLVAFVMFSTSVPAQNFEKLPPLQVKEYNLKNGLRVILHQDKSTPIVTVGVWYHVGSKNETPGRTGFAHLFEHMMFQGSKNYDADYFTPLQEAGGEHKRHDQPGPHLVFRNGAVEFSRARDHCSKPTASAGCSKR